MLLLLCVEYLGRRIVLRWWVTGILVFILHMPMYFFVLHCFTKSIYLHITHIIKYYKWLNIPK